MAISITRAEVKRKCMISDSETAYDDHIDALIAEMQPSIEFSIAEVFLEDTENMKLQAALKLGMLEIISGEFLQQLYRELGAVESFKVGSITIGARREHGVRLIEQGTARLLPFREAADQPSDESGIASTVSTEDRQFTRDSMKGW